MYERLSKATHAYVGRNPCGCMASVVVDTGDKETAKSVAEFIRHGRTVERLSLDEVRKLPIGCKCKARAAKEPALFGATP